MAGYGGDGLSIYVVLLDGEKDVGWVVVCFCKDLWCFFGRVVPPYGGEVGYGAFHLARNFLYRFFSWFFVLS